MRVLMVSKACLVGQYQAKLEALARHADIDLTVIVPPTWHDERGTILLERLFVGGYDLLVEPIRFNGQFHFYYFPTLPSVLKRVRPDIVHIDEEPYNLATWLALVTARRQGARALFFTWQNLYRRYPPPFSLLESYVLRSADHAIAGSRDAGDVLNRKGYRGPLSIIPQFGVDPDVFAPRPTDPDKPGGDSSSHPFRIGFNGRLVEEKGIETLLYAVSGLSGNWTLLIQGGGPDKERLAGIAGKLGIANQVRFEPLRPSSEMTSFYRQIDVCVLPSVSRSNWTEQFGRVLIEAMSCGVPVIGSDCGEIPNVVGDAGLIFPQGDVAALRSKIRALYDPSLRSQCAKAGRDRVVEHFSQARVAQQTSDVYRQMFSDSSPRA